MYNIIRIFWISNRNFGFWTLKIRISKLQYLTLVSIFVPHSKTNVDHCPRPPPTFLSPSPGTDGWWSVNKKNHVDAEGCWWGGGRPRIPTAAAQFHIIRRKVVRNACTSIVVPRVTGSYNKVSQLSALSEYLHKNDPKPTARACHRCALSSADCMRNRVWRTPPLH